MSADFTDSAKAEMRLRASANKLHELVEAKAGADTVIEFSGERRKNLLAEYMAPLLEAGTGVAAAEMIARAHPGYQGSLDALREQHRSAESVRSLWRATQATWESARSLLSMSKELLRQID